MKISFIFLAAFSLITVSKFTPAARGQNLLANPYFTQGFTGWSGTYGISINNNGPIPINPSPQFGDVVGEVDAFQNAMYQNFATVIGVTYQVTWDVRLPDLAPNGLPIEGPQTDAPATLNVFLNGALVSSESIQNRTYWQPYTDTFTATGTSTQLSFQVPGSEDVFMDYATAIAVPEPSSALLLLLALPLFLAGPRLRLVGNK